MPLVAARGSELVQQIAPADAMRNTMTTFRVCHGQKWLRMVSDGYINLYNYIMATFSRFPVDFSVGLILRIMEVDLFCLETY